jgi:hypothetical protein
MFIFRDDSGGHKMAFEEEEEDWEEEDESGNWKDWEVED